MIRKVSKQLTKYAEKIGFNDPVVWHSKLDGWWLESDNIEEYLGSDIKGAQRKLTDLCEGVYKKQIK
jgi:hypothetical protein